MHARVTSADLAKITALVATAVIMLLANGLQNTLVCVRMPKGSRRPPSP
jgi:hypothetical protein